MKDLIERLETAEAGSRELDWRIADLFDIPERWPESTLWPPFAERSRFDKAIPAFTTSLDAVLGLADLLGLNWMTVCRDALLLADEHPDKRGPGALALCACIAILRAKEPA